MSAARLQTDKLGRGRRASPRLLKLRGLNHCRAGGAERFRVQVDVIHDINTGMLGQYAFGSVQRKWSWREGRFPPNIPGNGCLQAFALIDALTGGNPEVVAANRYVTNEKQLGRHGREAENRQTAPRGQGGQPLLLLLNDLLGLTGAQFGRRRGVSELSAQLTRRHQPPWSILIKQ